MLRTVEAIKSVLKLSMHFGQDRLIFQHCRNRRTECIRLITLFVVGLYGCNTTTDMQSRRQHELVQQRTDEANRQLRHAPRTESLIKLEKLPQFARQSVPFDRSRMLPPSLGLVTIQLPGHYNIRSVANHIERTIRTPVILAPDVLLPASDFSPANLSSKIVKDSPAKQWSGAGGENSAQVTRRAAELVEKAGAPRQWNLSNPEQDVYELNHQGTVTSLLDYVAAQGQLQWAYENGQIRLFRLVSRTIIVKALPSGPSQSGSLTLAAGLATLSSSVNTEANFWEGVRRSIKEMMSALGKVNVDPVLGYVMITDTLANVDTVQRFIDGLNRQLGRQVSLSVEVLQVTLNSANQAGIDWNAVVRSAKWGDLTITSAPSIIQNAGGISLVKPAANGSDNSLFIRALERFGKVSSTYSSVINTMNRQPVPLGSTSTLSYLRQVTPSPIMSSAGATNYGPPALTPGEVTTGFTMNLFPVVLDSNKVMLQFSVSISSLKDLTTFTSGTGSAQQSVQQPNIASFATQQNMTVRSGDTIVLSGFESESTQSKEADLIRQSFLLGNRSNTRDKSTIVVLITPRVLEN